MNQSQKQIARLEGCLTPQQAVIVWLEEVAQCRNLSEFVDHLRNQPEGARPHARLPEQLRASIEQAMKGQRKETVEAEVRRAVRDAAFLLYLHRYANIQVTEPLRAWGLQLGLLRERLFRLAMERDKREEAGRSGRDARHKRRRRNTDLERNWVRGVEYFLTELYAKRDAINSISSGYFGGKRLLFADLAMRSCQ
jgi:hypothetical protein